MKIGIDCRVLRWEPCGLTRYLSNLLKALSRRHEQHRYYLFAPGDFVSPVQEDERFQQVVVGAKGAAHWECLVLPHALRQREVELCHTPHNYGVPWIRECAVVLTVHDLIPYLFPRFWEGRLPAKEFIYRRSLAFSIRRAQQVMTGSENTRDDIRRIFGTRDKPVTVVPYGADQSFSLEADAAGYVRERFGIETPFLLHLSGDGFNKNTRCVVEAFKRVRGDGFPSLRLVVAGAKKPPVGFPDGACWVGQVNDRELRALYSAAAVFLYPSLYEGFGLPVLEAFACGAPVVASRSSSIPEAAGEAAAYADPRDCADIARKIETLLRDTTLRRELVARGYERVKKFNWDSAAGAVLEVYARALSPNG